MDCSDSICRQSSLSLNYRSSSVFCSLDFFWGLCGLLALIGLLLGFGGFGHPCLSVALPDSRHWPLSFVSFCTNTMSLYRQHMTNYIDKICVALCIHCVVDCTCDELYIHCVVDCTGNDLYIH